MGRLKIDYELLNSVCDDVLAKHTSIRWTGVVNKNGVILAQKAGKGVKLLLSDEENEEYAATAIARQKTRGKFEPKIGKMIYSFGRYELLRILKYSKVVKLVLENKESLKDSGSWPPRLVYEEHNLLFHLSSS